MEITVTETTERKFSAKTLRMRLKVSDMFNARLFNDKGEMIHEQQDGYVPEFMPGGPGDYVDLEIDIDTGRIINWKLDAYLLQEWINNKY